MTKIESRLLIAAGILAAVAYGWGIIPGLDRTPPETDFASSVSGNLVPGGEFSVSWTWNQTRTGCTWKAAPFLTDAAGQVTRYEIIDAGVSTAPDPSPPPRTFTTAPRHIPSSAVPGPAVYYLRVDAVCHKSQRDAPITYTFGPAAFDIAAAS